MHTLNTIIPPSATPACPPFDRYVCPGDSRSWTLHGFDLRAVVHPDEDTRPTDFDCYSDEQIAAWRRDEWRFVGLVVTASLAGVELGQSSLWGIDCNFPGSDNSYLSDCADELTDESVTAAHEKLVLLARSTPAMPLPSHLPTHLHRFDEDGQCSVCGVSMDPDEEE